MMVDFLTKHSDTIFALIGIIIVLCIVHNFDLVKDTKYETLASWSLVITLIIGAGHIGETIGKWILK